MLGTMAAGPADGGPGPFVFSPGNFGILTAGANGDATRAGTHSGFSPRACWVAIGLEGPSGGSKSMATTAAVVFPASPEPEAVEEGLLGRRNTALHRCWREGAGYASPPC